jgi:outer membrane protein
MKQAFMKKLIKYKILITAILLFSTSVGLPNDIVVPSKKVSKVLVGIAYISGTSVYSEGGSKSRFLPYLSYKSDKIRLSFQEGLVFQFMNRPGLSFDVSLSPNFKPYNSKGSQSLDGMNREMTFDASLLSSYELARGLIAKVKLSTDISNKFNGAGAQISLSQFIPILGVPFIFQAGSLWYDQNRTKYFYGVYESEAKMLRPQYDPGAAFVPYLSINSFYSLTPKSSLFANITAEVFPEKVFNSPIIEKETSLRFISGISYKF